MTNWTTIVGLPNISNVISTGFTVNNTTTNVTSTGLAGTFGDPMLLGIFAIIIILVAGWKMRATVDLIVLSVMTIIYIMFGNTGGNPNWLFLLVTIIGGGFLVGIGLKKTVR